MEIISALNYSEPIYQILTSKNSEISLCIKKTLIISMGKSLYLFLKQLLTNFHLKLYLQLIYQTKLLDHWNAFYNVPTLWLLILVVTQLMIYLR